MGVRENGVLVGPSGVLVMSGVLVARGVSVSVGVSGTAGVSVTARAVRVNWAYAVSTAAVYTAPGSMVGDAAPPPPQAGRTNNAAASSSHDIFLSLDIPYLRFEFSGLFRRFDYNRIDPTLDRKPKVMLAVVPDPMAGEAQISG
jgi:hypothetical protein